MSPCHVTASSLSSLYRDSFGSSTMSPKRLEAVPKSSLVVAALERPRCSPSRAKNSHSNSWGTGVSQYLTLCPSWKRGLSVEWKTHLNWTEILPNLSKTLLCCWKTRHRRFHSIFWGKCKRIYVPLEVSRVCSVLSWMEFLPEVTLIAYHWLELAYAA